MSELCKYASGYMPFAAVISPDSEVADVFIQEIGNDQTTEKQVFYIPCTSKFSAGALKELVQIIRKEKISIVHSHGYKSDFYAFLAKILPPKSIKLVATNHNWTGLAPTEKIYQWIDCKILRFFDGLIAVSDSVKQLMVESGIPSTRIEVIKNGVDVMDPSFSISRQEALHKIGLESNSLVIGNVARISFEKGNDLLLKAFSLLTENFPELRLVLVGDGPEYDNLTALAKTLMVDDKVLFLGNRSDARSLYKGFDVFVLPSRNEGLPMALLEAMAAEIPVVATRVGGVPKVIQDGVNGLLAQPENVADLAHKIEQILRDENSGTHLAQAGRNLVLTDYSSMAMVNNYAEFYHKIVEKDTRAITAN